MRHVLPVRKYIKTHAAGCAAWAAAPVHRAGWASRAECAATARIKGTVTVSTASLPGRNADAHLVLQRSSAVRVAPCSQRRQCNSGHAAAPHAQRRPHRPTPSTQRRPRNVAKSRSGVEVCGSAEVKSYLNFLQGQDSVSQPCRLNAPAYAGRMRVDGAVSVPFSRVQLRCACTQRSPEQTEPADEARAFHVQHSNFWLAILVGLASGQANFDIVTLASVRFSLILSMLKTARCAGCGCVCVRVCVCVCVCMSIVQVFMSSGLFLQGSASLWSETENSELDHKEKLAPSLRLLE